MRRQVALGFSIKGLDSPRVWPLRLVRACRYVASFLRQAGGWKKWQHACRAGAQERLAADLAAALPSHPNHPVLVSGTHHPAADPDGGGGGARAGLGLGGGGGMRGQQVSGSSSITGAIHAALQQVQVSAGGGRRLRCLASALLCFPSLTP